MSFNNIAFALLVLLLTGCISQQKLPDSNQTNDVVSTPITEFNEYAQRGLLTIESDYRDEYRKALTALHNKQYKKAASSLDKLIQLRPDLVSAMYNKALLLEEQGNTEESIKLLEKAHFVDPANVKVCSSLGRALRELGKFKDAEKVYSVCLGFEDQSPIVHKNYGILLDLYLRQSELALQQYKLYLEKSGNSDKQVKGWILDLERRIVSREAG